MSLYSISHESIVPRKGQFIEFVDLFFEISASHAGEM